MNKKLKRMLQPGMGLYFVVLVCFCAWALLVKNYPLALGEAAVTAILFTFYLVRKRMRSRDLQSFIQSTFNTLDMAQGAELPFPMVLTNLVDGRIIWTNEKFSTMTGFREKLSDQHISDILPELTVDWLISGKNEYPYDLTIIEGSSSIKSLGWLIRARPIASICCSPPDSIPAIWLLRSPRRGKSV